VGNHGVTRYSSNAWIRRLGRRMYPTIRTYIGHVAGGMHRQGYDLQLTQYDDRGWRATFYTNGNGALADQCDRTAWERTPWRAVQTAAGRP